MDKDYSKELAQLKAKIDRARENALKKHDPESDLTSLCNYVDAQILDILDYINRKTDIAIEMNAIAKWQSERTEELIRSDRKKAKTAAMEGKMVGTEQAFITAIALDIVVGAVAQASGSSKALVKESSISRAKNYLESISDEDRRDLLDVYLSTGVIRKLDELENENNQGENQEWQNHQ